MKSVQHLTDNIRYKDKIRLKNSCQVTKQILYMSGTAIKLSYDWYYGIINVGRPTIKKSVL